jgi:transposase-like protein
VCKVCRHPSRRRIEEALARGESNDSVAREHGIARSTLQDHRRRKHNQTNPLPPETLEEAGARKKHASSADEIRALTSQRDRRDLIFRFLAEGRWKGPRTVLMLATAWPDPKKNPGELLIEIAEMAADAALRHARLRGSRDLRREETLIEARSLYQAAKKAGKYADALGALKFVAELDGLTYEPGTAQALLEAQAWRIVQPIIRDRAPQVIEEIDRALAGADRRREKAIRLLRRGEIKEDGRRVDATDSTEEESPDDAEARRAELLRVVEAADPLPTSALASAEPVSDSDESSEG